MFYFFCRILVFILSFLFFPATFLGRENIPKKGGFILASNHISYLDPMVLAMASFRPLNFLAKEELFKNKIFGKLITWLGTFSIKRDSADISAVKESLKRLKKGNAVLVFPEGTRIAKEKKIHPGIGLIAVKAAVPVIPVYIEGADRVLPLNAKWPKRHGVKVHFGSPVKFSAQEDYSVITQKILDSIYSLVGK